MNITEAEMFAFLTELEVLCRKHRIIIGGCGCCESPWLDRLNHDGDWHYHAARDGDGWGRLSYVKVRLAEE